MVTDEYFSWTPNIAHKDGSKFLDEDEKKKSFLESIFLDLIYPSFFYINTLHLKPLASSQEFIGWKQMTSYHFKMPGQ
jgi:hypothetical protein